MKSLRLHSLASEGDLKGIKLALDGLSIAERKRYVNAFNIHGVTPLQSAVYHNQLDAVNLFLSIGADCRLQSHSPNWTSPLHLAAFVSSSKICRTLLLAGADPFLLDGEGFSPHDIAAGQANKEAMTLLSEKMDTLRPFYRPSGLVEGDKNFSLDDMNDEYWRRQTTFWSQEELSYICDHYSDGGSPPALLLRRRQQMGLLQTDPRTQSASDLR